MPVIVRSIKLFALNILLFSLLRIVFFFVFRPTSVELTTSTILKSFWIGFRFDLRLAGIFVVVFLLLASILKFIHSEDKKTSLNSIFFTFFTSFFLGFYALDFGHYSYLNVRIDSSAIQFISNLSIALNVIWDSYPVIAIAAGFLVFLISYYFLLKKLVFKTNSFSNWRPQKKTKVLSSLAFALVLLFCLYGKFSFYPLRWSEAFFSKVTFLNHLALNPPLYFLDTLKFSEKKFSKKDTKENLNTLSAYLGFEQKPNQPISFHRVEETTPQAKGYNIVFIMMESLAAHKSGIYGNPLNPTPYLSQISRESLTFMEAYSPTVGTARGVFNMITGIPDVAKVKTSSRNPLVINQRLGLNDLTNYDKYYFLGGSANWANIRAIFSNNIEGIKIFEEGDYGTPDTDVWGLSDLDLFLESHKTLQNRSTDKPFFAFIQTAGFHRPYTIPKKKKDFKVIEKEIPKEKLNQAGFYSMDQLNSLRFSDYSLGHFFDLVKKSKYYQNTIFVISADHGLPTGDANFFPAGKRHFGIESDRIPIIFHNPSIFKDPGKKDNRFVNQSDILPSAIGLVSGKASNYGLGRNLFAPTHMDPKKSSYAFTVGTYSQVNARKLFNKDFLLIVDDIKGARLHPYQKDNYETDLKDKHPEVYEEMLKILNGYYFSAQYLLHNNKK